MAERAGPLTVCAAGDVALGGTLEGRLDTVQDRQRLVAAAAPWFAGADIRFVDLDCTLDTAGAPPHPEEYRVTATVGQLALLQELGVDIVAQANNHTFDHGWTSAQATQAALQARGMAAVGAGADLAAARSPRILEHHGQRVGFLAYASAHPWVGAVVAGPGRPGVAPLDPELMVADVRRLRGQVDWVVVSAHWGKEYLHYPPPAVVALGRALVDAGAALVLGHHPHVIQAVEAYGAGLIAYSLGNFLYPDYPEQGLRFTAEQRTSLVLEVQLADGCARLHGRHLLRSGDTGELHVLTGAELARLEADLVRYAAAVQKPDYPAFWQRQARRRELQRLWGALRREVLGAGWRGGAGRLLRLGRKNVRAVGRSLGEIVRGTPDRGA